ncbi:MAG: carbohydrate ABC transporter permease [Spirochaetaceae bacterium]|jgi:putative aldouronate transport system permease protein|nr:carbohydrate ABC transporter permease [Spirochaetaceae bacterium]
MAYSSLSRKVFSFVNAAICLFISLLCIAPVIHVLAISFSAKDPIISGAIAFLPKGFNLKNYAYVMKEWNFYTSFGISVVRTILALIVQLSMTVLASYPISLRQGKFRFRGFFTWYFLIAVLFSGSLIPTYLVVKNTGLINSIWSLVLPGAVPLFYVILMQNFMKNLPEEIKESAAIDGAGHFLVLSRIVLPLCRVSMATISLFIIVDNWNAWFDGMLYINDNAKFPLQTYLRSVLIVPDLTQVTDLNTLARLVASGGADAAKIFLAMLPILLVYPFAQKHFVKGIVLGSVKG